MKSILITIAILVSGFVFSQVKKSDSLLSKNKLSSKKQSQNFYKNVDTESASKYKILNSKPKNPETYLILGKKEKQPYKSLSIPKDSLPLSSKKKAK